MRCGGIVTVAVSGDYGKPRPAVVIQSDQLGNTDSILVCLMTSELRDASFHRIRVEPAAASGLRQPLDIMVDKTVTVRRDKCGRLDQATIVALNRTLSLVIGIAD